MIFFDELTKMLKLWLQQEIFVKELVFFYIRGLSQACGKFLGEFGV